VTDVLARVIEREPDLSALPLNTPAAIRRLLRHCLEKDPRRRLADAADVARVLSRVIDAALPFFKGCASRVRPDKRIRC